MYEEEREKDSKPVNNPYDNINMPLTTQRFRVCFGISASEIYARIKCVFGGGNTLKTNNKVCFF